MSAPQILSEAVQCLGNHSLDKYGESLLTYFTVDLSKLAEESDLDPIREDDRARLMEAIGDLLEAADVREYSCGCSHDCCGHRFSSAPKIIHICPIYRLATVTQSSSLNI